MKFKELRMTLFLSILALAAFVLGVYRFVKEDSLTNLFMAFGIIFFVIILLLTRLNITLFDEAIVAYRFVGIAFVPYIIEYETIDRVDVVSKYSVCIMDHSHKKHSIYVFNTTKFVEAINEKIKNSCDNRNTN